MPHPDDRRQAALAALARRLTRELNGNTLDFDQPKGWLRMGDAAYAHNRPHVWRKLRAARPRLYDLKPADWKPVDPIWGCDPESLMSEKDGSLGYSPDEIMGNHPSGWNAGRAAVVRNFQKFGTIGDGDDGDGEPILSAGWNPGVGVQKVSNGLPVGRPARGLHGESLRLRLEADFDMSITELVAAVRYARSDTRQFFAQWIRDAKPNIKALATLTGYSPGHLRKMRANCPVSKEHNMTTEAVETMLEIRDEIRGLRQDLTFQREHGMTPATAVDEWLAEIQEDEN